MYEFQAGRMAGQLLEEEKEFGDLLVTETTSPKGIGIYVNS
jgi:hypothetical protein